MVALLDVYAGDISCELYAVPNTSGYNTLSLSVNFMT